MAWEIRYLSSGLRAGLAIALLICLSLFAYDKGLPYLMDTDNAPAVISTQEELPPAEGLPALTGAAAYTAPMQSEPNSIRLDNRQYLYVVDEHSVAELEDLLQRADEIARHRLDDFADLAVTMVIHGPSIKLFKQSQYPANKKLIDLAARLDAINVIDLKICQASLNQFQISRQEVPAFIESVPFAPDEIQRLNQAGYINL